MNAVEQALTVYTQAKQRVKSGKFSTQDEVTVALWELVQEQQADLAKQSYKISLLESTAKSDFDSLDNTHQMLAVLNKARYTH